MHKVFDLNAPEAPAIDFDQFLAIDIRVGTITSAEWFPEARKPAYKPTIDFGDGVGTRKSFAQITDHYEIDDLIGRQTAAVVNFPARQIGPFMSEVLVLSFPDEDGRIVLACPSQALPNGARQA